MSPWTAESGNEYGLCLLDTNVVSECLKNKSGEGREFLKRCIGEPWAPCFSFHTLIELRRRPDIFTSFLQFFTKIPWFLLKPLYDQAESAQAIAFLVDVAQEDKPADRSVTWPPAREAVQVLARMGPLGGAALESLHAGGKVKNPRARGYLEYLSEHSFHDPQ